MNRNQFLKSCLGGLCPCAAGGALSSAAPADTPAKPAEDWRLPFVKDRYAALLGILGTTVSAEMVNDILRQLGRHCASRYPLIQEHQGDPDGFISEFKKRTNEGIVYDRAKGIVTVIGPERSDCYCPLVDRQKNAGHRLQLLPRLAAIHLRDPARKEGHGGAEGVGRPRRQAVRVRDPDSGVTPRVCRWSTHSLANASLHSSFSGSASSSFSTAGRAAASRSRGAAAFAVLYPIRSHLRDWGLWDMPLNATDNLLTAYLSLAQAAIWIGAFVFLPLRSGSNALLFCVEAGNDGGDGLYARIEPMGHERIPKPGADRPDHDRSGNDAPTKQTDPSPRNEPGSPLVSMQDQQSKSET